MKILDVPKRIFSYLRIAMRPEKESRLKKILDKEIDIIYAITYSYFDIFMKLKQMIDWYLEKFQVFYLYKLNNLSFCR